MRVWKVVALVSALTFVGCAEDGSESACDPTCDASACQVCDESGEEPVCRTVCDDGLTCEAGVCIEEGTSVCEPECTACSYCDLSGETPECVDPCGEGTTCNEATLACDPIPVVDACNDACDPANCEICDETLATPACVTSCGEGTECVDGSGVCAVDPLDCPTPCDDGEYCLIQDDTAACVTKAEFVHTSVLVGPYTTPLEVTADCLDCHEAQARDLMQTPHWNWEGATPNFAEQDGTLRNLAEPFGKKQSINNFCVAIDTNEARCTMCHAGYGWGYSDPDNPSKAGNYVPAGESAVEYYASLANPIDYFDDPSRIDCLVCHSSSSKYQKGRTWAGYPVEWDNNGFPGDGRPSNPSDPTITNASEAVLLETATNLVGSPGVGQCGRCHFGAGGGDNVKKGDIGSTLRLADNNSTDPVFAAVPTSLPKNEIDVHLGAGLTCTDCHRVPETEQNRHRILGQGVHNVPTAGRLFCTDCHDAAPHGDASLDNHALDVACATCHVPTYSNAQPTKMYWDWTVAGDRTGAYDPVVEGIVSANPAFDSGQTRGQYDFKKGAFLWGEKVKPDVAWFDGRTFHLSTTDTFDDAEKDSTVLIAAPVANYADIDAKIYPFKVMRGKQFADVTTANNNFLIVPELFGPGGLWASVPASEDRKPGASPTADAMWDTVLTQGAQGSGQTAFFGNPGDAYPTERSWDFVETEMWMLITHEIAPAANALGGTQNNCGACHGVTGWGPEVWAGLGYSCDPLLDAVGCGSRNL